MSSFKDGPEGYCMHCARIVAAQDLGAPGCLSLMTHWLGHYAHKPDIPGYDQKCGGSLKTVAHDSAVRAPKEVTRWEFTS